MKGVLDLLVTFAVILAFASTIVSGLNSPFLEPDLKILQGESYDN